MIYWKQFVFSIRIILQGILTIDINKKISIVKLLKEEVSQDS